MNNQVAATGCSLHFLHFPLLLFIYTPHTSKSSTLPSVGWQSGEFHLIVSTLGGKTTGRTLRRSNKAKYLDPPNTTHTTPQQYTATNGGAAKAPRPLHACQGLVDPAPPHSKSPLTFSGPDSVTIVNTCWKGMATAPSLLSWHTPPRHVSSGAPPPRLFNQPASLPAGAQLRYISYLCRPSLAF